MKKQEAGQTNVAIRKNAEFFAENDWYKSNQGRLEMYRLIAESAAEEVKTASADFGHRKWRHLHLSDRSHSSRRSD